MSTIVDVAKSANVSVATVSRVLNASPKVRPETREKVYNAIRELHYEPNSAARNLRTLATGILLVILPKVNMFHSKILLGISETANKLGYSILICQTNRDQETEAKFLNMLDAKKADGAIILTRSLNRELFIDLAGRYPIVQCAEYFSDLPFSRISVDNYSAARTVVKYLAGLGHQKIAFIGSVNNESCISERYNGFRDEMKTQNFSVPDSYYQNADAAFTFSSGYSTAYKLLCEKDRPSAVFCVSDELALGAIRAAEQLGISVPDELSVVGFDNVELATMFHPSLTTIEQPCYEIGVRAAEMVFDLLKMPSPTEYTQIFLKYRLIERESTGILHKK